MQFGQVKRREFITLIGGAAALPFTARAQQGERVRRIGVLMSLAEDDKEGQARLAAFLQGLQELGWIDGRNMSVDTRWGGGGGERIRKYTAELVALTPDVILVSGGSLVADLLQATRTVPIVFTQTPDPVGAGFVESLARPGGNATGFTNFEYGMGGKWQGDRAECDARGCYAGPRNATGNWPVFGYPLAGAVAQVRRKPDQRAPTRRDRTCYCGHRPYAE
jgi:hypothetical protein